MSHELTFKTTDSGLFVSVSTSHKDATLIVSLSAFPHLLKSCLQFINVDLHLLDFCPIET